MCNLAGRRVHAGQLRELFDKCARKGKIEGEVPLGKGEPKLRVFGIDQLAGAEAGRTGSGNRHWLLGTQDFPPVPGAIGSGGKDIGGVHADHVLVNGSVALGLQLCQLSKIGLSQQAQVSGAREKDEIHSGFDRFGARPCGDGFLGGLFDCDEAFVTGGQNMLPN